MFQMVEVPVIMEATFSKAKRIAAIDLSELCLRIAGIRSA
jgi:hypothetical protein